MSACSLSPALGPNEGGCQGCLCNEQKATEEIFKDSHVLKESENMAAVYDHRTEPYLGGQ